MELTYHAITFELSSQKLWKLLSLKAALQAHVVCKFQRKKNKTSIQSELPRITMLPKTPFGLLGVKYHWPSTLIFFYDYFKSTSLTF